jgi:hypothetical protein
MGMGFGYGPSIGDIVAGNMIGGAINNAMFGGQRYGPSTTDRMLENQQRQDEREMDKQKSEVDQLKAEIAALKAQRQ